MKVLKNVNLEEVKKIYNSSTKEFISEESNNEAVTDKNMENYLYYLDDGKEAVGYITIYTKSNFIEQEEFDVTLPVKEGSVYIWEIGTKKGYEGRGIATNLVKYIINIYNNVDIYSVVDVENIGSVKIHEKLGFKPVESFIGHFFSDKDEKYIIYKLSRQ